MWSNVSTQEDKNRAFSLGADFYLVKSEYLPEEMQGKIMELIEGKATDTITKVKIETKELPPTKEDS